MNEIYLKLAGAYQLLADGYKALAEEQSNVKPTNKGVSNAQKQEVSISIEEVRSVLAEKSRDGKTKEIKALLLKYDADKLSSVKPEDYSNLLKDAEAL
jgi:hypothetical protein